MMLLLLLLTTFDAVYVANVTQWAAKEQAILDECSGWMAGTRGTWSVVPRSARILGGFTSQYKQDKLVWQALFNSTTSNRAAGGRTRTYAEVAANHYRVGMVAVDKVAGGRILKVVVCMMYFSANTYIQGRQSRGS